MQDRSQELFNSLIGYGGIVFVVLAALGIYDGRLESWQAAFMAVFGVALNGIASALEFRRDQEVRTDTASIIEKLTGFDYSDEFEEAAE